MFFCPQCKAEYFWPFAIFTRTFSFTAILHYTSQHSLSSIPVFLRL